MVDDKDRGPAAVTDHGATIPGGTATPQQDTLVPNVGAGAPPIALPASGYQLGEMIGKGGMGEVLAAQDQRIGREVAIKRMRSATPDGEQVARFLREARIQARLDHPAIVPVHELGTDEAGRPYFTMKRISGRTLAQRLTDGATQQQLLRALVDVCLAIDLAHARGVVHRDLKPSNIMMGDYGEVYVLDWGVARVLTDTTAETPGDIDTLQDGTQSGALLGTPGYMSPEQIKGERATQAADVYALGAILFEILAGETLHPRGSAAISSTLTSPQDAPARRRPERSVPPELDALCILALAEHPTDRPTARALADQIQAYLDGDRDVGRRRTLAAEQLAAAQRALDDGGTDARATAIRRAGRALALDPDSAEAAALVTSLIVEPPAVLPAELEEQIVASERKATQERTRDGMYTLLALFLFLPALPFLGIKSPFWLAVLMATLLGMSAVLWHMARTGRFRIEVMLVGALVLAVVWSRLAGIFLLTPVFLTGTLLGITHNSWLAQRRWLIVAWTALAFLIPMGLEELGLIMRSWEVTDTAIISHSSIFGMSGPMADASLIVANIAFVALAGLMGARMHQSTKKVKRRLQIQAWHLNHLLPNNPRPWATQR